VKASPGGRRKEETCHQEEGPMAHGIGKRIFWISVPLFLFLFALLVRLGSLQIGGHQLFLRKAARQVLCPCKVEAPRGTLADAKGRLLALDLPAYDLHCYVQGPLSRKRGGARGLVRELASILLPDRTLSLAEGRRILKILREGEARVRAKRKKRDRVLVRGIQAAAALERLRSPSFLRKWIPAGLALRKCYQRVYPLGQEGGPVVGGIFSTRRGPHYLGLEALCRKGGPLAPLPPLELNLARWGLLDRYLVSPPRFTRPSGIARVTLDSDIQRLLSVILSREAARVKPKWAAALVMDPRDGRILAMSSWPAFDPNRPGDLSASPLEGRRNHALESRFPPGSTMKSFIVAAALQEGLVRPGEAIDCSWNTPRGWRIPGCRRVIHDDHRLEPSRVPLEEVIVQSSNIGAVKIGRRFDPRKYLEWLVRFGLDRKSGLPLPGEAAPDFRKARRLPFNEASFLRWDGPSISHGYAIGLNLVGLATAYCSLVNGGYRVRPFLLEEVRDPRRGRKVFRPAGRVRILSPGTASVMRSILGRVVSEEEGTAYRMAGEEGRKVLGGKTGTSFMRTGGKRRYWAVFVGFAPKENPRYLAAAVFYKENTHRFYGGSNAGPTVRDILLALLERKGVE